MKLDIGRIMSIFLFVSSERQISAFLKPKSGSRLKLTYLHGGEVVYQPQESIGPRILSDFEMVYVIEGPITYISDGVSYAVPPGGFVLGRPGFQEVYQWNTQGPTRHAYFHFGMEYYPSDWPAPSDWPRVRTELSPVCASLFRHIIQHIYEHNDWPAARPAAKDCRLVETLIDTFIENHQDETVSFERARPEPVRRALLWMAQQVEEHPQQSMTLSRIAKQANVTEKHLCRLFSRSIGHSPMQTFTLLKLQTARTLLNRSNLSIKEIAERCGFENPLYFSRRFSQAYGCPPTTYREQLRRGNLDIIQNILPVDLTPRSRW